MLEAKECQQGMLGASGMGLTKALLLLTQSASIIAMVTSPKEMSDKQRSGCQDFKK